MKTKLSIIILSVVAVIALAACTGTTNPTYQSTRQVSVTGHGEVYIVPDVAYINIGVQNTGDTVTEVLNQNSDQATGIRTALGLLGVEELDIQTSNFSVYPMQQYDMEGQMTGTLYQANNTVFVTVRDLTQLGKILDAVVRSGANTINGITFDVLDASASLEEARAQAVEDAKAQALQLAEASGATLGVVQYINAYSSYSPYSVYEGKGGGGAMMDASVPVATGQMIVSVDVSMAWELK